MNNVLILDFTDNDQLEEVIKYRSNLMVDNSNVISNEGVIKVKINIFDENIILNTQYIHCYNYQPFHIYLDGVNTLYKDSELSYSIINKDGVEIKKLIDLSYGIFEIKNNILRGIPDKDAIIDEDKTYQELSVRARSTVTDYSIDVSYHIFYVSSNSFLHHTHELDTNPPTIQTNHIHNSNTNGNGIAPSESYIEDSNTLCYYITYYMFNSTDVIKRKITDRVDYTTGIQALIPTGGVDRYEVKIKQPIRPKGVVMMDGNIIEYRMRNGNTDIPEFNEKEIVEWLAILDGKVLYKEEITIYLQYQHIQSAHK